MTPKITFPDEGNLIFGSKEGRIRDEGRNRDGDVGHKRRTGRRTRDEKGRTDEGRGAGADGEIVQTAYCTLTAHCLLPTASVLPPSIKSNN